MNDAGMFWRAFFGPPPRLPGCILEVANATSVRFRIQRRIERDGATMVRSISHVEIAI